MGDEQRQLSKKEGSKVKSQSYNSFLNDSFLNLTYDNYRKCSNCNGKSKRKGSSVDGGSGTWRRPFLFLRVSVVGGGCSGLSYKIDFDNELKPADQVFESEDLKIVTDLKSFLYLVNTELDFSDGLNGKGFFFQNPNASRTCACGESFAV